MRFKGLPTGSMVKEKHCKKEYEHNEQLRNDRYKKNSMNRSLHQDNNLFSNNGKSNNVLWKPVNTAADR